MQRTRYIALCGAPQAGKSQVQRLLADLFGVRALDDSRPLRDAAKLLYGLSEEDVSTQEGKARIVTAGGRRLTVRDLLGELGCFVEGGDPLHFIRLAKARALRDHPGEVVSFGSVRMNQASLFQGADSLVIEVLREGFRPERDFDRYDETLVHAQVHNIFDGSNPDEARQHLEAQLRRIVEPFLHGEALPGARHGLPETLPATTGLVA